MMKKRRSAWKQHTRPAMGTINKQRQPVVRKYCSIAREINKHMGSIESAEHLRCRTYFLLNSKIFISLILLLFSNLVFNNVFF